MKFTKVPPGFKRKDYSLYREFTRRDFKQLCAYCFRHEEDAGGIGHFEQDHFKPQNQGIDPAEYLNLYWSCRECNGVSCKGGDWPTEGERKSGRYFCDPCRYDPWSRDYRMQPNGELDPITPAGDYTIEHIRLNRPHLLRYRRNKAALQEEYRSQLDRLRTLRRHLTSAGGAPATRLMPVIDQLIADHKAIAYARPFVLAFNIIRPPIPGEIQRLLADLEK